MAAQIGADFDQLMENIQTLVKSIEGAGVGSRPTEVEGLRTNTTSTYLNTASAYAGQIEQRIAELAADTAAFRDALRAVLEEKQASEENLSSSLSQIAAIVDDPSLTPATVLADGGAQQATAAAPASETEEDDSSREQF